MSRWDEAWAGTARWEAGLQVQLLQPAPSRPADKDIGLTS